MLLPSFEEALDAGDLLAERCFDFGGPSLAVGDAADERAIHLELTCYAAIYAAVKRVARERGLYVSIPASVTIVAHGFRSLVVGE